MSSCASSVPALALDFWQPQRPPEASSSVRRARGAAQRRASSTRTVARFRRRDRPIHSPALSPSRPSRSVLASYASRALSLRPGLCSMGGAACFTVPTSICFSCRPRQPQPTRHRVAFCVRCQVVLSLFRALFVIPGTLVAKRTTIDHGASSPRTRPTPLIDRRSSIVVDRRIAMRRKRRTDRPQRSSGSVGSFLFGRCRFFLT